MAKLTQINLRVPPDVEEDLQAVCDSRKRTEYILDAIRVRLDREPAVQRKRAEREAAIEAKTSTREPLTPAEAAHWWRKVKARPPLETTRYVVCVEGEAVIFDREDLPAEYRHQFGIAPADPAKSDD